MKIYLRPFKAKEKVFGFVLNYLYDYFSGEQLRQPWNGRIVSPSIDAPVRSVIRRRIVLFHPQSAGDVIPPHINISKCFAVKHAYQVKII
jgi:hypothetical protein